MQQRRSDLWFAFVFGGGFLVLGLFCLSWSIPDLWVGMRSYTWPKVLGRVITVRNVANEPPATRSQQPALLYEYAVNGRRYIGARIAYDGLQHRSKRAAIRLARHYQAGQEVSVHHNPHHPRAATLKRGVGLFLAVPLIVGVSGTLLGLLVFMSTFFPAPHERLHPSE